jgi:nuclease S1
MSLSVVSYIRKLFAILAVVVLFMPSAWPWGRIGHRGSAELAESLLNPRALAAVHDLLGPGITLADISNWADEHRNPNSGAWHYVDVPIAQTHYDRKFCPSKGCVVSKIEDFRRILQNPRAGRLEKQKALKYLIHFIADLHQPLHAADNSDRGGNLTQVRFFNRGSNLHRVWDSQIIEHKSGSEQEWLRKIGSQATPKNVAEWSRGTPEDWATESLQAAKEAYCLPGTRTLMKSGTKLNDDYCRMALPIIERQLAKAAVRMAFVLDGIFR